MRLIFDERKAAQAAAHLLDLHGGVMNYTVLIKLLYLADRISLVQTGQPITGDDMFSMRNGPVLSAILDLIHTGRPEGAPTPWFEYVSDPEGYSVRSTRQSPENDELSRFEIGVLDAVYERYGKMEVWPLVRFTHSLPEWRDPGRSVLAIEPETILRLAGKPQEDIETIIADAEERWLIDRLQRAAL